MALRYIALFSLAVVLTTSAAHAQTAADSTAIRAAALHYLEGWYAADADRMAQALHPDLAKRIVRADTSGASRLDQMSAERLLGITQRGGGSRTPPEEQRKDVIILDIEGGTASVKTFANTFFDYLHLARYDGEWMIINVLWDMLPRDETSSR